MNEEQELVFRRRVKSEIDKHFTWPNKSIEDLVIRMIKLYIKINKEN